MANVKFSQLPLYVGTPGQNDFLPIVDATTTPGTFVDKRILISQFSGGGGLTSIGLTVPSPLSVNPATLTANGIFAITWSTGQIPVANLGTGTASNATYLRGDSSWQPLVASVQVTGQSAITGPVSFTAGDNITLSQSGSVITINSIGGGGGGGGFSSVTAVWSDANSATKDAYTGPGNINSQGITIRLVATSNPGTLSAATIALNSTNVSGTFTVTGAFPNYTITVPSSALTGNAAEIAATVTVGVVIGSQFNLSANNLNNTQPVAFNTIFTVNYTVSSVPFYQTTASLSYSYSNSNAITSFGGIININGEVSPRNATAPSFTFNNVLIGGGNTRGSATGVGLNGAGSSTVGFSGSIAAVQTFVPAFYAQTANNTPPTFTTASSQTNSSAAGSTITYPIATASTQYDWIATALPLARILITTPFGNSPLVPDVTAPTQTISGQVFNVFGFTRLSTSVAVQLLITAS